MTQSDDVHTLSTLDQHVAPGLRLWMLIALVGGVLLIMVVLVCCFMRIRIPRTKRQIDLIAAKRKMRSSKKGSQQQHADEKGQTIVMNSMRPKNTSGGHKSSESKDQRLLVHGNGARSGSKQQTEV